MGSTDSHRQSLSEINDEMKSRIVPTRNGPFFVSLVPPVVLVISFILSHMHHPGIDSVIKMIFVFHLTKLTSLFICQMQAHLMHH